MMFHNKVVLITGAASGIGRACASLFDSEQAIVIATDQDESILSFPHSRIQTHILHVEQEQDWKRVIEAVIRKYHKIDVFISCAGISSRDHVIEGTVEEWNQVMSINALGTYLGMKYCIPHMQKQRHGAIVNITSVGGLVGVGGGTVYPASKGAVYAMTRRVAMEYGKDHIRANVVCPGWINTNMTLHARKEKEQQFLKRQALDYIGEPEDVAHAVLFLASERAKFITGAQLIVDGGFTAG